MSFTIDKSGGSLLQLRCALSDNSLCASDIVHIYKRGSRILQGVMNPVYRFDIIPFVFEWSRSVSNCYRHDFKT
jgi:hypothetical protein